MVSMFFEWCLHFSLFNSHDLPEETRAAASWGRDFKNMADVNEDDADSGQ